MKGDIVSKQSFRIGLLLAAMAFFVVACGTTQTASIGTGPVPTVAAADTNATASVPTLQSPTQGPTATPAPSVAQAPTGQTAANAGGLPQSLKDVASSSVYTFRVDPTQTTIAYAVDEVLLGNKQITRGTTNTVDGQFQLGLKDGKPYIVMSKLQVDLRTLTSDNAMRDQAIRMQWLQSNTYPYAVFVAKEVQGLPTDAVQGQPYTLKVSGDMTIRNITKPVTFDITVTLNGTTLTGEGTTQIYMKDFGFNPPEILGRFTVTDPATITIKGVANLAEG
jgi:polyisoprenoid-binding protein YceI